MMKQQYEIPEIKVILLNTADVIVTSQDGDPVEDGGREAFASRPFRFGKNMLAVTRGVLR